MNERMQYTYQLQFVVQSCTNQDGARIFLIFGQPQEISSLKLVTS
jgi:hypothetical protein